MFRGCNLRQKEIINIRTAEKLGYVRDVEINEQKGSVEALIAEKRGPFWRYFFGGGDMIIPWSAVEVVGDEVVLVRFFDTEVGKLT